MKVLWVNPVFLDYRVPLYKEVYNLADGNFFLIFSKERVPQRCISKIENEIGNHAISIQGEKIFSFGKLTEFSNSGVRFPLPKGLYKSIKKVKPDIVIAEGFAQYTPWAVLYCFLHSKPLIVAYERTAHTERNCPRWRRWYRRFIGWFTSGYIVNGSLTKEYLISIGVKANTIFTGAMCADSNHIAKAVRAMTLSEKQLFRNKLGLKNESGLTYIFVGRLIDLKGVQYLLEAWKTHIKRYPDDYMLIVGGGPMEQGFRKDFEMEASVKFTGMIDYSLIHNYYAISDVFVIPTLEDNWSLVVPEAMASGLPIASSIYNGCYPELVLEGVNGSRFDPYVQESILKSLDVFHHCDLIAYGKASVKIEKEFNPKKTADNIYNALITTLNKKNGNNK